MLAAIHEHKKTTIITIGGVLLIMLSSFACVKKADAYTVFDSSAATYSYDSTRNTDYADNIVKVTFADTFLGYGAETIEDYTGARYFKDPADKNSGYLVLPTRYSMDGLVSINDDLLNEYVFLSYAGIILK